MTIRAISRTAAIATAALALPGSALADHHAGAEKPMPPHVAVIDATGANVGTVVAQQTPNGVLLSVSITGLPPGEHGFHLHEKGICDPSQGFTTSSGHYNPRSTDHGFKLASGPHAGDMPNQFAGADGVLRAHVLNPLVTLGEGFNSLNDADGTALIVHAGKDDYESQPTGDAGGRLVCAVIAAPKEG